MEIINIIVHDSDTGIISLDSFVVVEEQLKNEVVEQAEMFFVEKCVKTSFKYSKLDIENLSTEDLLDLDNFREMVREDLEDGYWESNGVTVSFVWSYPENI